MNLVKRIRINLNKKEKLEELKHFIVELIRVLIFIENLES